jgi:hypothetical protein
VAAFALGCSGPDAPPSTDAGAPSAALDDDLDFRRPAGLPRQTGPELARPLLLHRPSASAPVRCNRDVCVHGATDDAAPALLDAASSALDTFLALKLPRPRFDGPLGGDGRLDLYVQVDAAAAGYLDPGSASSGPDLGSGFVVTPPLRRGCHDHQALATAVARVMLLGQDAAMQATTATMLSRHLGILAEPCNLAELEDIDTAQRSPERTFTGDASEPGPAAFLFPWFLENKYGTNEPGKLTVSLASISAQSTREGALVDEPDVFDALRVTQQRNQTSLGDTLLEFAIHRAFLGSRSDEMHMLDVAKYGALGRVRIEWDVPYSSLPRSLRPLRPIEPLGATYVYIDLEGAPDDGEVTFVIDWEMPVGFSWAALKLDATGAELGRKKYDPVLGSTHVEATIRDLRGATALLIVGVNEGESRRDEPFDPDALHEAAKSYVITLAK